MAYMDVAPANVSYSSGDDTKTIVLLHGKNFCGATWEATARVLSGAGYRVIMPDQIGFCKSSKLESYQFSLQQLASNTKSLLTSLGITNLTVMGHSMGGMISTRFALMYPEMTSRLVLVSPLGLEDWKALGVPYQTIDTTFVTELASNYTSIRTYEQATYYAGTWDPAYDRWVNMLVGIYTLPNMESRTFAWDSALVTDAIFTQPIYYELSSLKMDTLLVIGDKDNTAIGKAWAPPELRPSLGRYDIIGKRAATLIPKCTLVEFPDLGHTPQIQAPDRFHSAILSWLA